MLKMNYSNLTSKSLEQIHKQADRRGINPYAQKYIFKSREDIIGEIIAHDAYYEGRNDAMRSIPDKHHKQAEVKVDAIADRREKYRLQELDYDPFFLRLTPDQIKFAQWCFDNKIDFSCTTFEKIDEVKYVSP